MLATTSLPLNSNFNDPMPPAQKWSSLWLNEEDYSTRTWVQIDRCLCPANSDSIRASLRSGDSIPPLLGAAANAGVGPEEDSEEK